MSAPELSPSAPTGPIRRVKAHTFHEELTHPIVEIANHIVSPLTASLTIFAVHKTWQVPSVKVYFRALKVLYANGHSREVFSIPRPSAGSVLAAGALGVTAWAASRLPAAPVARASMPQEVHVRMDDDTGAVDLAVLSRLYSPEDAPLVAHHLSQAPTVRLVERQMRWLHDKYGLQWYEVIVGSTCALRCALAPLNISLLRNSLRMKVLMPEVSRLGAILHGPSASGAGESQVHAARAVLSTFKASQCHPLKHILAFPVLLPPTILSIFGAIHNLSVSAPGMDREGTLWFPDLLAPDVSHLLPIASALTWLMNVEAGAGVHYHASPRLRSAVRLIAVTCWPLASTLPNGVLVFWVTSNLFALARAAATRPDAIRRLMNIPLRSEIAALSHLPKPILS